jgi:hypothetical protein
MFPSVITSYDAKLTSLSCPSGNFCLAMVQVANPVRSDVGVVLKWNGQAWTRVPNASAGVQDVVLEGLSCLSPTACTAVLHTATRKTLAEHWDGTVGAAANTQPERQTSVANTDFELIGVSCAAAVVL